MNWSVVQSDALDWLRSLPTDSADLCITSPPYTAARTYGVGAARGSAAWVQWMRPIIVEACRVSRLVALNCADQVKKGVYQCGDIHLIADLTRLDGLCLGPSPYCWVKSEDRDDALPNGQPGSGGPNYQRRDWEPFYVLARPENLPPVWADNKAFGKAPQWTAGGPTSHRRKDGARKGRRIPRGSNSEGVLIQQDAYFPPPISNPGNVIRAPVGGGRMGHPLAHKSEAPMTLGVAERFVCWFCPPDGLVIDPFTGSGTTGHAANKHGRRFAGCDLRECQVDLSTRRLASVADELAGV